MRLDTISILREGTHLPTGRLSAVLSNESCDCLAVIEVRWTTKSVVMAGIDNASGAVKVPRTGSEEGEPTPLSPMNSFQ